ncbi:MAG: CotH kinase family protein [Eubacteriales bacterium]|nr:CotH kinase family protein [Eubacteriales bacterium]
MIDFHAHIRPLLALSCISLLMLLCLFFAGQRKARETEKEAESYQAEHSLFENITICKAGAVGAGGAAAGSQSVVSQESSSLENSASGKNTLPADELPSSLKAGEIRIPAPGMEVSLYRRRQGKWVAYVPAEAARRGYIRFTRFAALALERVQDDSRISSGPDHLLLKSGDRFPCGNPENSSVNNGSTEGSSLKKGSAEDIFLENGSLWHAQALGSDGEVLEEADFVVYFAQEVPTLYVNTSSGNLEAVDADKSVREECRYVFYTADGKRDCGGRCVIHGRGNSSWKEDKKQYSLNLASAREVLGMSSSRKFALIANTSDPSNLRNKVTFDLSCLCGMASAPESVFVNVFFNGEYRGLYLLAQRPNAKGGSVHIADLETANKKVALFRLPEGGSTPEKNGQTRVPEINAADAETKAEAKTEEKTTPETDKVNGKAASGDTDSPETVSRVDAGGLELHASAQEETPENITGGYLLEIDGRYEDEEYWFSTKTHHFVVKFPEAVPLREEEYIAGYVREAEAALFSADGINPDTGKSVEEYLDVDSWAKMYLMQDFMVQWDVESFSFFVYKDADDPLLYCGPVWDFDLSMGSTGLGRLPDVMQRSAWLRDHREGWLTELMKHKVFSDAVHKIAKEQFFPVLEEYLKGYPEKPSGSDTEQNSSGFAALQDALRSSSAMDSHRWGEADSFEESAEKLRAWLRGRAVFWQGYNDSPDAYCKVTFRYGFKDMDIYVRRGEQLGFVPTEEYGEYLYSSFRKKHGEIDGWTGEDGRVLTAETVINKDQVFLPFSGPEDDGQTNNGISRVVP